MDTKKVLKAVALQLQCNYEIETLGEAQIKTFVELEGLAESFTIAEADLFCDLCMTLRTEEERKQDEEILRQTQEIIDNSKNN